MDREAVRTRTNDAPRSEGVETTSQDHGRSDSPAVENANAVQSKEGRWKRSIYLGISAIFFVLGALGVMLPGLPATPFLLLTSYFLVRSSPRLNEKLLHSRIFGPVLVDWQVHGGVRPHVKIKAIVLVVLMLAVTIYLSGSSLLPKLLIALLAIVGMVVIVRLPQPKVSPSSDTDSD